MEIKGTTRVCGLIGNPVEHSISPLIHNTIAELMGLDMVYTTFRVDQGKVDVAVKGAYALNVLGMNATVPHKQEVIESLVEVDDLAAKIGAVNTLVRVEGGYKGYNTDIYGLKREVEEAGIVIKDNVIVILGAGGASRAITFLCASEGAKKVYLLNRSIDKAVSLASEVNEKLGCSSVIPQTLDYAGSIEESFVTIQTTSVGLYPDCDAIPVDNDAFYDKCIAGVDIIYNPANTAFMKRLQAQGKPAYNGLKMLLYQGVAAFELWNKVKVPDEIVAQVYDKMKKAMNINE